MSDVVFDKNFFKKLQQFFNELLDFIKEQAPFGIIIAVGIVAVIIIQQVILSLLNMVK